MTEQSAALAPVLKTELADWTMISVQLEEGEIITPSTMKNIIIPDVDLSGGIVIDGRAPIWFHAFLVSKFAPASWIAINDPKLGGAVVVQEHKPGMEVGSIQSTALII